MAKIVIGERLAWFNEQANTGEFWDRHWEEKVDLPVVLEKARSGLRGIYKTIFRKWVPRNMPVLEGGCGVGNMALAMQSEGYDVVGVDFSEKTIQRSKECASDLNIQYGDIFKLNFPDDHFGAYISLGVVEHYWEGPDRAIQEAHRVIKQGGYFICSVPFYSPIRKFRKFLGDYSSPNTPDSTDFYQYAFTQQEFTDILNSHGFDVAKIYYHDSALGARKELWGFERVYNSMPLIFQKAINHIDIAKSFLGHIIFFVAQKK